MSATTDLSRKIVLKGAPRHDEAIAAGAIKPGQLLKLDTASKVVVHNDEGGYAERAFAVEDALQGGTIDTAYATTGDHVRVSYALCLPGDEVAAYIKDGIAIVVGESLISDGAGNLCGRTDASTTTQVEDIIAICVEAIDLTGSTAVSTRTRVRIC